MAEAEWLAVGDNHLEKLESLFPNDDHLNFHFQAENYIADYARTEGIKNVIKLGDVFEIAKPEQRTVRRFIENRKQNEDLIWHEIRGNHDYDSNDANSLELVQAFSELGALTNTHIYLSPTEVEIDGIPFYFMSYPYHRVKKTPYEKIVLCHLEFQGAMRDNGLKIKQEGYDLPKTDKYIVGHLHRHQILNDRIYYPGTMLQMNFGEPLPKGFFHCRASSRKGKIKLNCQFVRYEPPFKLITKYIESKDDLKKIKRSNHLLYRLIIGDNVTVPPAWFMDHPNVRKWSGAKLTKETKEKIDQGQDIHDGQMFKAFKPTRNLKQFIQQNYSFNKNELKETRSLIYEIIADCNLRV